MPLPLGLLMKFTPGRKRHQLRREKLAVYLLHDDLVPKVRQFARNQFAVELLEIMRLEVAAAHGFRPERLLARAAMDSTNPLCGHRDERAGVAVIVVRAMNRGPAGEFRERNEFTMASTQHLVFLHMQRGADVEIGVVVAAVTSLAFALRCSEFLQILEVFGGQPLVDDVRLVPLVAEISAARVDARFVSGEHANEPTKDLAHLVGVDDRVRRTEHEAQALPLRSGTIGVVDNEPVVCHEVISHQRVESPPVIQIHAEDIGADEVFSLPTRRVLSAPACAVTNGLSNLVNSEIVILEACRKTLEVRSARASLVLDLPIDCDLDLVCRVDVFSVRQRRRYALSLMRCCLRRGGCLVVHLCNFQRLPGLHVNCVMCEPGGVKAPGSPELHYMNGQQAPARAQTSAIS